MPEPGVLEILNVQGGDVKITFDKDNGMEVIRGKRIIEDMLRRGFALVVEVERDGVKKYERVQAFDAERGEYIIADWDSLEAAKVEAEREVPETVAAELSRPDAEPDLAVASICECGKPMHHRGRCLKKTKRLPVMTTKATGIGRTAGG